MGVWIQVHPETAEPLHHVTDLLQATTISVGADAIKGVHACSFSDEFLQTISAATDAERMGPPANPVALDQRSKSIDAQPETFQTPLGRVHGLPNGQCE